ncbi:MAG: PH domain-containing protein [Phycisphaerales bacterium JB059]
MTERTNEQDVPTPEPEPSVPESRDGPAPEPEPSDRGGRASGSPGSGDSDDPARATEPLDDRLRPLDPKALTVDRIVSIIFAASVTLALLVVLTLDLVIGWWAWTVRVPVWAGVTLTVLGMLWLAIVWTRLSHNATVFRVNEQGLEIRRGVLWRRVISVPRSRVQHTDVGQGPLQRRFGLSTLTVHTAATRTPSVQLVGLARETAMRVRENLRQMGEDDGV